MRIKLWLQCLTLVGLGGLFSAGQTPADAAQNGTCAPGQYCARSDRKTEAYPEKPPAIGPA